nr:hypothetical protein Iba_chr05aCG12060 [Ipomoea batatas]GMD01818.1 hypothetical protein Iba_chr05fCG10700 [Ipomoea batatas]
MVLFVSFFVGINISKINTVFVTIIFQEVIKSHQSIRLHKSDFVLNSSSFNNWQSIFVCFSVLVYGYNLHVVRNGESGEEQ